MATQLIVKYEQVWEPKRPYTCECGTNTTLGNRFKHNKTLIHQAYLQKEIYRANGTLEEEKRKQEIIDEKDKADRKERQRVYGKEYKARPDRKEITRLIEQTDYRKEQKKQYRESHKEEKAEWDRQPIICECGLTINKSNKQRHMRTTKHINLLNQQLFINELNNYNF